MNTNVQILSNHDPAAGALLTRASWVDSYHFSPSIFRFEGKLVEESHPGSVSDVFGQRGRLHHFDDVQIFNGNNTIFFYEIIDFLKDKIGTFVGNSFMNPRHNLSGPVSFGRTLAELGESALSLGEILLFGTEEPRVFDLFAIRESSKSCQSNINTNGVGFDRQGIGINIAREGDEPFICRCFSNGNILNSAVDGSMQDQFKVPDFWKSESVFDKAKTSCPLWIGNGIVTAKTFPTRIARIFPRLAPTKEGIKREIDPELNILEDLGMNLSQIWNELFPLGKEFIGVIKGQSGLFVFPRFFSDLQGFIINKAAGFKMPLKHLPLVLGGVGSIFEGFTHLGPSMQYCLGKVKNYLIAAAYSVNKPVGFLMERISGSLGSRRAVMQNRSPLPFDVDPV